MIGPPADDDGHNEQEGDDQAEADPVMESEAGVLARLEVMKLAMALLGRAPATLGLYDEVPCEVLKRRFEAAHLRAVVAASKFLAGCFHAATPPPKVLPDAARSSRPPSRP